MNKFINVSDAEGKDYCINVNQIIYVQNLNGKAAFLLPNDIVILSTTDYSSIEKLLQNAD